MTESEEKYMQAQLDQILFEGLINGDINQTEGEFYADCMTWDAIFNKPLTNF